MFLFFEIKKKLNVHPKTPYFLNYDSYNNVFFLIILNSMCMTAKEKVIVFDFYSQLSDVADF